MGAIMLLYTHITHPYEHIQIEIIYIHVDSPGYVHIKVKGYSMYGTLYEHIYMVQYRIKPDRRAK